jgi:hypothetical protein
MPWWADLLVLVAFLTIGAFVLIRRGRQFAELRDHGVETMRRVVMKRKFNSNGGRSHVLRYEDVDSLGRVHTHKSHVSNDVWEAHGEAARLRLSTRSGTRR